MHKASHARHREQQQEILQFILGHAETISQAPDAPDRTIFDGGSKLSG
jgi:hypothetical protein